jgi:hypothetical protein
MADEEEAGDEAEGVDAALTALGVSGTETVQEAGRCVYAEKREEAVRAKLGALEANGTWEVVDRPNGANIVGSK